MIGFDTETTSPNPLNDARIVTAAIVLDVPGIDRQSFTWLCDPECEIDLGATAVHGISTEYAREKGQNTRTVIIEILAKFDEIYQTYGPIPLVVVNAVFDLTIMQCEIKRLGIADELNLQFPVIDTLVLDRMLDEFRTGRRTLTSTCANYGIVIRGAHTAEGDVIASLRLARAIGDKYPWITQWSLRKLMRMQEISANQRGRQFQEYRRKDDVEPDFIVNAGWPILEGA